mgnify:CR=1 FL=1
MDKRIDSKERVVWWNGKLVPESEARLSIYDSALMFGDMVFEMTRSFRKKQFKLREHLERLSASTPSAKITGIRIARCVDKKLGFPKVDTGRPP